MHPKPVPRRNTITKPSPAATAVPLHPSQMALPANYITSTSAVPTPLKPNMVAPNFQNPAMPQRPYLAAEMAMMQDALKIAALKTAETIRYMSTVQRVRGTSDVKGPPPAIANELRLQLARYDQLCDIVEARLVRAHAALSARLERERAANPKPPTQNVLPIQFDSPMSDDVPLSLSNSASQPPTTSSNSHYTAPPKSRDLSSLAAQRPPNATPDFARILSPVTLASNATMMPTVDTVPSHHAVVPELLNALRRQEQEQARSALHQQPAQDTTTMDIFGAGAPPSIEDLFMSDTNPGGVNLDIDSAVAAIDSSVGAMGPSVADIDSAVSAMNSSVPGMDEAVAELDSAVAEMDNLDSSDALFGDLHANPGDAPDSFAGGGLQSRGFPAENDPFATGDIPSGDAFQSVSGTGEDGAKEDLLASLDAGESSGMDLEMNMDLMEMGDLGIGAGELGGGNDAGEDEMGLGDGGIGMEGAGMGLEDVGIAAGNMGMGDVGIDGMDMGGDDIEAMWGNMDNFFGNMGGDISDGIHIKTEQE